MKKRKIVFIALTCLLICFISAYSAFCSYCNKWSTGPRIFVENTANSILPEGVELSSYRNRIIFDNTEIYTYNSVEFLKCKSRNIPDFSCSSDDCIIYVLHYYRHTNRSGDEPFIKAHKYDTVYEFDKNSGETRKLLTVNNNQFVVFCNESICVIYDFGQDCAKAIVRAADGSFNIDNENQSIDLSSGHGADCFYFYTDGDKLYLSANDETPVSVLNIF